MIIRELLTRWGFQVDDSKLKDFSRNLQKSKKVAQEVAKVSAIAVGAMAIPAARLEHEIGKALTIAQRPVEEFQKNRDRLTTLAADIGNDLGMSANDVGKSYYNVLSTGADITEKSFENLTRAALKFAKVGGVDVADSVNYLDGTVKAFNLTSKDYLRTANVIQRGTFLAKTNATQLADALKEAGPPAAGLGMKLEETVAVIAALADKGKMAANAGHNLRRLFSRFKKATGPSAEALAELGVNVWDTEGKFIGFIETLRKVKGATEGLTQKKRSRLLQDIAGQHGETALLGLLQSDLDKLEEWEDKLKHSQGTLDKGLAQLKKTAWHKFFAMWYEGISLLTIVGNQLLDIVKPVLDFMAALFKHLRKFADQHKRLSKLIAGFALLALTLSTAALAAMSVVSALTLLGSAAGVAFLPMLAWVAVLVVAVGILAIALEDIFLFFTNDKAQTMTGALMADIMFWVDEGLLYMKNAWLDFKLWFITMLADTFDIDKHMQLSIDKTLSNLQSKFAKLYTFDYGVNSNYGGQNGPQKWLEGWLSKIQGGIGHKLPNTVPGQTSAAPGLVPTEVKVENNIYASPGQSTEEIAAATSKATEEVLFGMLRTSYDNKKPGMAR